MGVWVAYLAALAVVRCSSAVGSGDASVLVTGRCWCGVGSGGVWLLVACRCHDERTRVTSLAGVAQLGSDAMEVSVRP